MFVVAELAEHRHADGFLWFDELAVEKLDQNVSLTAPPEAFTYQATIRAECDADAARSHIPSSIATIDPESDGCTLRIGTDDLDWLARYLLTLPFSFEVVAPDDLRTSVRRLARTIASRHTSQTVAGGVSRPELPFKLQSPPCH